MTYTETGLKLVARVFHDAMHVVLFLVSIPILFGFFSDAVHEYMEQFDYWLHVLFVIVCGHTLYEWLTERRHRKEHAKHDEEFHAEEAEATSGCTCWSD